MDIVDPQDFYIVDGLSPCLIEHQLGVGEVHGLERQVNLDSMTVHIQKQEIRTFANFLGQSLREQGSVRQIFQRGVSITQDNLPLSDMVIELSSETDDLLPKPINITTGDIITNLKNGQKWCVEATDFIGFDSGWRLACRKLS